MGGGGGGWRGEVVGVEACGLGEGRGVARLGGGGASTSMEVAAAVPLGEGRLRVCRGTETAGEEGGVCSVGAIGRGVVNMVPIVRALLGKVNKR